MDKFLGMWLALCLVGAYLGLVTGTVVDPRSLDITLDPSAK